MRYCDVWYCDVCDFCHVSNALRCSDCSPQWWARGWQCDRCHGSCIHIPASWLHRGWVCKACRRIPEDWRNHDHRQREREQLIQSFPKVCVIVHDLAGNDLLRDNPNDEPRQLHPLQKIGDVVDLLRSRLRLRTWEKIKICKDVEVMNRLTWLGSLADAMGQVHLLALVVGF